MDTGKRLRLFFLDVWKEVRPQRAQERPSLPVHQLCALVSWLPACSSPHCEHCGKGNILPGIRNIMCT